MTSVAKDSHYVARVSLRHFATPTGKVSVYRTLVAHDHVPMWSEKSTKAIGKREHLYTRIAAGRETDDVEKWLNREFETPAAAAIEKVTSDAQMKPEDWANLVRFAAAQDVRTPARLGKFLRQCQAAMPGLLNSILEDALHELRVAREMGKPIAPPSAADSEYLPMRVIAERVPGEDTARVGLRAVVGRGMWLFAMRRWLTETLDVLHQHRWSVLTLPRDLNWFTSDDPVIRLNYSHSGKYDFNGTWGSPGTEILLPLSPRHLLYTQIGRQPPMRGTAMPRVQAELMRQFTAEHAHRMIFAASPEADVPALRPRIVSHDMIRQEEAQWSKFHEEQSDIERSLMDTTGA